MEIQIPDITSTVEDPSRMNTTSDINLTENNAACIQSDELNTNSTDLQGDDLDISMEPQSGSQCDTSPELSSTSSLLELGRVNLTFMQQSMGNREAMLQAYRSSRGSPLSLGEEVDFPPRVERLVGWRNDFHFQIIHDEAPMCRFSESSSETSNATTHVSATESDEDEDDIETWFRPIPLAPDFDGENSNGTNPHE